MKQGMLNYFYLVKEYLVKNISRDAVIYEGNYLLDENAITLYPITFFTCELSTTEIVKDKEIKIEIISKDELSVDGTTYKRIDSKNFDDSASGLRYLFKTAIESLPSE